MVNKVPDRYDLTTQKINKLSAHLSPLSKFNSQAFGHKTILRAFYYYLIKKKLKIASLTLEQVSVGFKIATRQQ